MADMQLVMGIMALMPPRNLAMRWFGTGRAASTVSTLPISNAPY